MSIFYVKCLLQHFIVSESALKITKESLMVYIEYHFSRSREYFFLNIDIFNNACIILNPKLYCDLATPLYDLIYTLEQTLNFVWLTLYV